MKETKKEIKELHEIFLKHPVIKRDNREVQPGDIFWALKGEKHDGNRFAVDALKRGAHIAVVDDKKLNLIKEKRFFWVENTLQALQDLAHLHRDYVGMPLIGITGSNGKTTTKELVHAVLSQKYNTSATKGNYNNHIGVPLTLLDIPEDTDIAVVEMGSNHFGEIKKLSQIANPDFGIITSIGKAHLEFFKDEKGVFNEKKALFEHIKNNNGFVFVNADDPWIQKAAEGLQTYSFSYQNNPTQVQLQNISDSAQLKIKLNDTIIQTRLTGLYNLSNIGYAITVGKFFNISDQQIKSALENYVPQNMRSQIIEKKGNLIILDTYNANPTSMKAALQNLLRMHASHKIAILGDMFELGESATREHQAIVDFAAQNQIEAYLIGENFALTQSNFPKFKTTTEFVKSGIFDRLKNSHILIKGSRGMQLEKIVE